jgi:molybdopterin-guanine dinucleotide biosynthesis protein A
VIIDAVVLAGGRSSRLDGTPKAGLVATGHTLLERTLEAAALAREIVVVGDSTVVSRAAPAQTVSVVRETPPFSGPAAAIAAGLAYLAAASHEQSDFTLVLACDMPDVAAAVGVLVDDLERSGHGAVSVSIDGRVQYLAGIYPTATLASAAEAHRVAGDLANLSVRALLAGVTPSQVAVPPGATDDIDTWEDAARFGVAIPDRHQPLERL